MAFDIKSIFDDVSLLEVEQKLSDDIKALGSLSDLKSKVSKTAILSDDPKERVEAFESYANEVEKRVRLLLDYVIGKAELDNKEANSEKNSDKSSIILGATVKAMEKSQIAEAISEVFEVELTEDQKKVTNKVFDDSIEIAIDSFMKMLIF